MEIAAQMRDAAQAFAAGLTLDDYMADLRVHRHDFIEYYERLVGIVDELQSDPPLPEVQVLAISEDWCPHCVFNVPILARFAEASSQASLRIVRRSECQSLADRYRGRGDGSRVPVRLPEPWARRDWPLVGTLCVVATVLRSLYQGSPQCRIWMSETVSPRRRS